MENKEKKIFGNKYFEVHGKKREKPLNADLAEESDNLKKELGNFVGNHYLVLLLIATIGGIIGIALMLIEEFGK